MYRILIIDDNKLDTEVAKLSLSNHQVIVSHSAFEGLRLVKEMVPDAVITEIDLPYMDGYHIIESIKNFDATRHIPVIVLSAEKNSVSEERSASMGAADFIQKPFVPSILDMKVCQIIENAQKESILYEKLISEQERSRKDTLTGLFNREYAKEKIDEYIGQYGNGALFMIDMDNFKAINDNYGHDAGDKTLITFADALRSNADDNSILARIGGDEFIAFLPGNHDRTSLSSFAGQLIAELANRLESFRFDTNTSVSLGIAVAGLDGGSFDSLYNAGDRALYHVKTNGKNDYCFVSDITLIEEERSHGTDGIGSVQEALLRSDDDKSHAFSPEFGHFASIYQYLVRQGVTPGLILLTFDAGEDKEKESEYSCRLHELLLSSLRKSDLFTKYSSRQFLIMIPMINKDAEEEIAGHICTKAENMLGIKLTHEINA